ncbi:hypothetical protein SAMN05444266_101343 [Chitinophaga jiangningensis]|uniref:DUF2264 domain-containing protein n=1 Tax=Chitinophaga jiangningensis TaxID=1419482 RepID=A0A1M6VS68_9BACT|nr:DUF2264 domain-containing protein [Chitinophaga jiangningensis]SHK84377.1 hypothetical protein SAMN05444266_101343 [Chitinophaga jiangningensis]
MNRRKFLHAIPVAGLAGSLGTGKGLLHDVAADAAAKPPSDRDYNATLLYRIAHPVIDALSRGQLKQQMPREVAPHYAKPVDKVTYLEAFGRTISGVAPWLELGGDDTAEGRQRAALLQKARTAMHQATDPNGADYMTFNNKFDAQPLVDGAFLALGILRAPNQLWGSLPAATRQQVIDALKGLRVARTFNNNWVLFAAIIEAFLLQFDTGWDRKPVDTAISKMMEWYKGDSMYGDGSSFHYDYYNGFVMHPMLVQVLKVLVDKGEGSKEQYELALKRMQRYGAIQERLIMPDGAFPVVGRSMAYRSGAFQPLAQLALEGRLPAEVSQAQVRSALTAMHKRIFNNANNFDKQGWLQIGFCGHQPEIGDYYISTGSLYLCTNSFLPLGLPAQHEFWTAPAADWSAVKAYGGQGLQADHAITV